MIRVESVCTQSQVNQVQLELVRSSPTPSEQQSLLLHEIGLKWEFNIGIQIVDPLYHLLQAFLA